MRNYTFRHAVAMSGGLACIAAETFLNITHLLAPTLTWWTQPLVIAIGVAGIAQAIAAGVTTAAARERRWINASITALGLIAAITFSFTTSYIRIAETSQERRLDRDSRLNGTSRAQDARIKALVDDEKKECATVGPKCREIREEIRNTKASRAAQGDIIETNVLGQLSHLPELALPLMLLLLGLSLIAYAEAPAEDDTRQTSFPADEDPLPGKELFEPIAHDARAATVASFRAEYAARHGREPSVRTIARATNIPSTSVHRAKKRVRA